MRKRILILTDDYWHRVDSISPLLPLISNAAYDIIFSMDPAELYKRSFDLVISFKDPIEDDQIPTPVWCDDKWTPLLLERIKGGMGFIAVHAGLTDLPEDHPMTKEVIRATFISHPAPCPVKFLSDAEHPLLEGVGSFVFPAADEHYVIRLYDEYPTAVIARTESENGVQPAVWTHILGKGMVCCITPSHCTENLTYPPFVKLIKNAIKYCIG